MPRDRFQTALWAMPDCVPFTFALENATVPTEVAK